MDRLLHEEIVPDVLDTLPATPTLQIRYDNNQEVNLGNKLQIKTVQNEPTAIAWNADPEEFYALCLTDPDAPTRKEPKMRERVHWLVGNIPGDRWKEGDRLIEYVPSCPPTGTGLHRYTFVLLRQPGRMDFTGQVKIDTSKEMWDLRRAFSIRAWAQKWQCTVHAANFYVAEWDVDAQKTRDKLGL